MLTVLLVVHLGSEGLGREDASYQAGAVAPVSAGILATGAGCSWR